MKYIIRYDEAVPRSKAIRYPSGKIKSLFYKHQRIFTEFLCFFELFYDEVAVFLCAVFHLHIVVIQICSRITPGFSKSFQNFVFTEFMCICSLLCIRTCPILISAHNLTDGGQFNHCLLEGAESNACLGIADHLKAAITSGYLSAGTPVRVPSEEKVATIFFTSALYFPASALAF